MRREMMDNVFDHWALKLIFIGSVFIIGFSTGITWLTWFLSQQ